MNSVQFSYFWVLNSQKIPVWWRWFYFINPVAWTLYGLIASQVKYLLNLDFNSAFFKALNLIELFVNSLGM